jgi:uncharacterized protein (TIGR03435 family)
VNARTVLLAAFSSLLGTTALPPASGQAPATERFEVASIKANTSGDGKVLIQMLPGGRFVATNVTLQQLIRNAYQLQEFQVAGGPSWIGSDRFDIVAKADGAGQSDPAQAAKSGGPSRGQLMLRTLLAERFALATHIDAKEMSIYALMPVKTDGSLGPQLKRAAPDCDASTDGGRGRSADCGIRTLPGTIVAGGATLTELADGLSTVLDRVVQNRTGLADPFAFTLRWTPDQIPPGFDRKARAMGLPPIDPEGPGLFTAVREQLGLKLDSQKGPVEILVVERAERPKEN